VTVIDRLNEGAPALGVSVTIADPFLAEVLAAQPFDFVMIDTEHAPMSNHQLQTQLIALRTSSASVLVRVANTAAIGAALDLGAHGVVVPHIESPEDCVRAVRAALYPPQGDRGVGPRRAARLTDRSGYLRTANDNTLVIAMIESGPGVDRLDEIVGVAGLDAVFIGVEDLSASLGHLDDSQHPDVAAAIDRIIVSCNAARLPFGIYARSAAVAVELVCRGARMISVGSDLIFFERGMAAVLDAFRPVREWNFGVSQPAQGTEQGVADDQI
jgi:2-keto-3-deoxy-L-rhamnonate aldolase RhmA